MNNSPTLRVLVVDDEPLIRWSLAEVLGESGHSVTEAGDGASAVRALTETDRLTWCCSTTVFRIRTT